MLTFPSWPPRLSALLFLLGALLISRFSYAQAPVWTWAAHVAAADTVGSVDQQNARVYRTLADGMGGAYIAGTFVNSLTLGATTLTSRGATDIFIAHLDAGNQWQWVVQAGGIGQEDLYGLAIGPTGALIVTGESYTSTTTSQLQFGSITLAKSMAGSLCSYVASLSPRGQWQWARGAYATHSVNARSAGCDSAGHIFVAGFLFGDTLEIAQVRIPAPASRAYFLTELTATGQHLRTVFFNDRVSPFSYIDLTVDSGGDVLLAGSYITAFTLGGIPLPAPAQYATFVARYHPATQQWRWASALIGTGQNSLFCPRLDAQGRLFLCGFFTGRLVVGTDTLTATGVNPDIIVMALDAATGRSYWAVQAGGRFTDIANALCVAAGRLYVAGEFRRTASFGGTQLNAPTADGFVAGLNADTGGWQWVKALTGASYAYAIDVVPLTPNDLLLGGNFSLGPVEFDHLTVPLVAAHTAGSFVARLTDIATGLPEDAADAVGFFAAPNPAHHAVRLTGTGPATLLDALGRAVRTATGPADLTLDLRGLAPGLYVVRRGGAMRRLVVE